MDLAMPSRLAGRVGAGAACGSGADQSKGQ